MAHTNLGWMIERRGDLAGALAEYRKALELAPEFQLAKGAMARVERLIPLLPSLDEVVAGRVEPVSASEALGFAQLCCAHFRRQYAAAARLIARAFALDPKIASAPSFLDEELGGHRYDAACSAMLAGSGKGSDAPAAPAARAELRKQALDWLRTELAISAKRAAAERSSDRSAVASVLSRWLTDSNLSSIRSALDHVDLPADERSAWDAFSADVRATIERARKSTQPSPMPRSP
jgi:tetratricopeptide (TPR) repeat protein